MPFSFRLLPRITGPGYIMRPLLDPVSTTFWDHCMTTNLAFGRQTGLRFSALSFNDSESHCFLQRPDALSRLAEAQRRRASAFLIGNFASVFPQRRPLVIRCS